MNPPSLHGMHTERGRRFLRVESSAHLFGVAKQEFMPFRKIYMSAFKNDIEYSQLLLHTAAALQANKFMQVRPPTHTLFRSSGNTIRLKGWRCLLDDSLKCACVCGHVYACVCVLPSLF